MPGERRTRSDGKAYAEWNGSVWVEYPMTSGKAAPKGPQQIYADTMARERAKKDVTKLEAASEGAQNAFASEATANRAEALLPRTPVGPFADQRLALGRAVGGSLGWLPGIPNAEETANLEEFRNIGSQGALGDVSKLKGPLSEKELAFIQNLQVNPGASRRGNQRVIDAQKWVARRQAAYDSALQNWTSQLGAPSAKNAQGMSFDQWWGRYSAESLPPPGVGRQAPSSAGNSGGGWKVLSVE